MTTHTSQEQNTERPARVITATVVDGPRGAIPVFDLDGTILVGSQTDCHKLYVMADDYACACTAYYYKADCSHTRAARAAFPRQKVCRVCGGSMPYDTAVGVCLQCYQKGKR